MKINANQYYRLSHVIIYITRIDNDKFCYHVHLIYIYIYIICYVMWYDLHVTNNLF